MPLSKQLMMKVRASSKAMTVQSLPSKLSKFRSMTAIWNVLVMTLIKTVSLLMPTLPLSRALSMLTASISWNALKSTLASMAVHPSISMLSTAMATKVLPAASTTCRRFVTANPSVANLVLKMTSLRLTMTIFWHKE